MNVRHILLALSVTLGAAHAAPHSLVNIQTINPHIRTDCIYATARNFTGVVLYESAKCYLLESVAKQLSKVQDDLEKQELGLLVWDAFRPMAAQKKMWEVWPDDRYVAPPHKGGRHTRGTTVDVTLVYKDSGKQLEMPTPFDSFSEKAWSDSRDVSPTAQKNRAILKAAMEKHGFIQLPTEWWHFDFEGWQGYPVLDVAWNALV